MNPKVIAVVIVVLILVFIATRPAAAAGAAGTAATPATAMSKFKWYPKLSDGGGDLVPWTSPDNFGSTDVEACASRCLDNPQCHSFGFDPTYVNQTLGKTGYCTLKSHAVAPTQPWSENGGSGVRLQDVVASS